MATYDLCEEVPKWNEVHGVPEIRGISALHSLYTNPPFFWDTMYMYLLLTPKNQISGGHFA